MLAATTSIWHGAARRSGSRLQIIDALGEGNQGSKGHGAIHGMIFKA
jgi:hypothetical protein